MDGFHNRHKRSFTEMSHPDTLPPSPHNFGDSATSNLFPPSRLRSAPSNDPYSFHELFERRRTPHPHNNYNLGSQEMADRSQSQPRPRLEHRTSQTVIDLTDEAEEESVPRRPAGRVQLRRSDAINLGALIDLTDDNDDDVVITGERLNPAPRPAPAAAAVPAAPALVPAFHAARIPSPGLFLPFEAGEAARLFVGHGARFGSFLANFPFLGGGVGGAQPMPVAMDYEHVPFQNRKPEHVPPPPARDTFTRSPAEGDTIICPSCEEELIHNKEDEELVTKKNGKPLSRKDREEHPFWAVKECGHVYCNSCFQRRSQVGSFREGLGSSNGRPSKSNAKKTILCSVEDCDSDVKAKDKWVGIFL